MRRLPSLIATVMGAFALTLGPVSQALAQGAPHFPSKPIRIIVPYAPGGFTDIVSRLIAQKVTTRLGQPILVENKPGASTILGAELVAKSPADGYTLLMAVTSTLSTNPLLYKKLSYKMADFQPIALAGLTPFVLSAHPSVPANDLQELIALEKRQPGSLNLATLGAGGSSQLVGEMFQALSGVRLTSVPYKGAGPALNDLMAGHVQLFFDGIATSAPLIRSGRLKGIALTAEKRSPIAPSLPTFAESGLPNMLAYSWYGLLAPAGTPSEIIDTLNKAVNAALQAPDVRARIDADGATAPLTTPREFGALINQHTRTWEKIIAPLNIQLD